MTKQFNLEPDVLTHSVVPILFLHCDQDAPLKPEIWALNMNSASRMQRLLRVRHSALRLTISCLHAQCDLRPIPC